VILVRRLLAPGLNPLCQRAKVRHALHFIIRQLDAKVAFESSHQIKRLQAVDGFGGIPRLKRDLGNAVVRDLLLTGRSFNVMKAQQIGLVSQIAAEGESLRLARATAAQVGKFDRRTTIAAKTFIKPIPYEELKREIDIFCELFSQPAVEEGLRKFVENEGQAPYLP